MTDQSNIETVCVLDALDECRKPARYRLLDKLVRLYKAQRARTSGPAIKFLVTSRPYADIDWRLKPITDLDASNSISADLELDEIKIEIDHFIDMKVKELAEARDLQPSVRQLLQERLKQTQSRTYLWLHLVFDLIEEQDVLHRTSVDRILDEMPLELEATYTAMLNQSQEPELARRILHIVIAASRALTVGELGVAVAMNNNAHTKTEVKQAIPWSAQTSRRDIHSICRLFLTVINSKVYLIHQTAKDFLLRDFSAPPPSPLSAPESRWKNSIDTKMSNAILASACIQHLLLKDFDIFATRPGLMFLRSHPEYSLFEYAAVNWTMHLREAGTFVASDNDLLTLVGATLCSQSCLERWRGFYSHKMSQTAGCLPLPSIDNSIMWACHIGVLDLVKIVALTGSDLDATDTYGRTALMFASSIGSLEVVDYLLSCNASAKQADILGQTPLTFAIQNGHGPVACRLLQESSSQGPTDVFSMSPLDYADQSLLSTVEDAKESLSQSKGPCGSSVKKAANDDTGLMSQPGSEPALCPQLMNSCRTYIETQLASGAWISHGSETHLLRKVELGATGLSRFYDNLMAFLKSASVPLARTEGSNERSRNLIAARGFILEAIDAIPTMAKSDSPFVLPHMLRAVAYCSQANLPGLAHLFCDLLSKLIEPHQQSDGLPRQIVASTKPRLQPPEPNPALRLVMTDMAHTLTLEKVDAGALCVEMMTAVVAALESALGRYHMQTVWASHIMIAIKVRLHGADKTLGLLSRLCSDIETHAGPMSPQYIESLLKLGQTQIADGRFGAAKLSGLTITERLRQAPSTSILRNRLKGVLCDGYEIVAQAENGLGNLDEAQAHFERAVRTARSETGLKSSPTKRHQEALRVWLIEHSRLSELV